MSKPITKLTLLFVVVITSLIYLHDSNYGHPFDLENSDQNNCHDYNFDVGTIGLGNLMNAKKIGFKILQEFHITYHISGSINFHKSILE